jgi:O-antigen/teichoic acid export membrane protein
MDDHFLRLSQRSLRGTAWSIVGGNTSQLLTLIVFVALARILGPDDFGVMATAIVILEISRAFFIEGIGVTVIASQTAAKDELDAAFWLAVAVSILIFSALYWAAPAIAATFNMPRLDETLRQMDVIVLCQGFSRVQEAWLSRQMQFRSLAIRSIAVVLSGGTVGVILALNGMGIQALVWQQVSAALTSTVLLWFGCKWRPGLSVRWPVVRVLLLRSIQQSLSSIANTLLVGLDGLIVAHFTGAASAGVFSVGKRIRLALQIGFSNAFAKVALPTLSEANSDPSRLGRAAIQAVGLSMLLSAPIFLGVAAVAPELVALLFGPTWRGTELPMTLLLVGGAFSVSTSYAEAVILIRERPGWLVGLKLCVLAILAVGAPLGALAGGAVGVATATMIAGIIHNFLSMVIISRILKLDIKQNLSAVYTPVAIGLTFLITIVSLRAHFDLEPDHTRLFLFVLLGATIYVGGIILVSRQVVTLAISAVRVFSGRDRDE